MGLTVWKGSQGLEDSSAEALYFLVNFTSSFLAVPSSTRHTFLKKAHAWLIMATVDYYVQ